MKCKACNAPLSIEDEKCPYCGTPNPDAIKHRQDMKHFTGEFLKTRSSVLRTASESASKSMRIVILCVLAVLLLLSVLFTVFSWDISYEIQDLQNSMNSKQYCAMLDQYEEEKDFLSFASLYNQRSLYGNNFYEEYEHVYNAANHYQFIYSYITSLLEEEHWDGSHEDTLDSLCDSLEYYYDFVEKEPYSWLVEAGAYSEKHMESVAHIHEKIENLLQMTFSMTDEEMEEFRKSSSAEKQVILERRFKENE